VDLVSTQSPPDSTIRILNFKNGEKTKHPTVILRKILDSGDRKVRILAVLFKSLQKHQI